MLSETDFGALQCCGKVILGKMLHWLEAYLEPSQISEMELFSEISEQLKDVWLGSESASVEFSILSKVSLTNLIFILSLNSRMKQLKFVEDSF